MFLISTDLTMELDMAFYINTYIKSNHLGKQRCQRGAGSTNTNTDTLCKCLHLVDSRCIKQWCETYFKLSLQCMGKMSEGLKKRTHCLYFAKVQLSFFFSCIRASDAATAQIQEYILNTLHLDEPQPVEVISHQSRANIPLADKVQVYFSNFVLHFHKAGGRVRGRLKRMGKIRAAEAEVSFIHYRGELP